MRNNRITTMRHAEGFDIVYPESRHVSSARMLSWAEDCWMDGTIEKRARNAIEAAALLEDAGFVSVIDLGKPRRDRVHPPHVQQAINDAATASERYGDDWCEYWATAWRERGVDVDYPTADYNVEDPKDY